MFGSATTAYVAYRLLKFHTETQQNPIRLEHYKMMVPALKELYVHTSHLRRLSVEESSKYRDEYNKLDVLINKHGLILPNEIVSLLYDMSSYLYHNDMETVLSAILSPSGCQAE